MGNVTLFLSTPGKAKSACGCFVFVILEFELRVAFVAGTLPLKPCPQKIYFKSSSFQHMFGLFLFLIL
jgi:hypothetical protein